MAMMRTRSQLNASSLAPPPPPPSPIPTGRGSRSAASEVLTEIIERSVQIPELTLPESYGGGTGRQQAIPAEIDYRLVEGRRKGSVERLVRSAREFGAFRISCHGITSEEVRTLMRESGRVFGVLEERDVGFRRSVVGNRDEIVWVRSWKDRMDWAREYIGPLRYRCFSQEMENIAEKLEGIAKKVGQIIVENATKQSDKRIQRGESVMSVYRYNHENITEQSPPLPTQEALDYTLSLHLPAKNCEFRVRSGRSPLSFHADPDTILVTFGRQLEEWSLGEFKSVPGEIIYHPDVYGSRSSFSIELKCSSLNLSLLSSSSAPSNSFSLSLQLLSAILLLLFLQFFLLPKF